MNNKYLRQWYLDEIYSPIIHEIHDKINVFDIEWGDENIKIMVAGNCYEFDKSAKIYRYLSILIVAVDKKFSVIFPGASAMAIDLVGFTPFIIDGYIGGMRGNEIYAINLNNIESPLHTAVYAYCPICGYMRSLHRAHNNLTFSINCCSNMFLPTPSGEILAIPENAKSWCNNKFYSYQNLVGTNTIINSETGESLYVPGEITKISSKFANHIAIGISPEPLIHYLGSYKKIIYFDRTLHLSSTDYKQQIYKIPKKEWEALQNSPSMRL